MPMNRMKKVIIAFIIVTFGIGQLLLISLNGDEILWEYDGYFEDYEGSMIQNIPPNPIRLNNYVIKVSGGWASFMHYSNSGSINLTYLKSGRIFVFEYILIHAGDSDVEKKCWSLPSGRYNLSWTNENCAFKYVLIKPGVGYPYHSFILFCSVCVTIFFSILSVVMISRVMELRRKLRKKDQNNS